jgi:hypothetical protein
MMVFHLKKKRSPEEHQLLLVRILYMNLRLVAKN